MRKATVKLNEIKLVGIRVKTSNSLEANPKTAKIGQTIEQYFANKLSEKISRRIQLFPLSA